MAEKGEYPGHFRSAFVALAVAGVAGLIGSVAGLNANQAFVLAIGVGLIGLVVLRAIEDRREQSGKGGTSADLALAHKPGTHTKRLESADEAVERDASVGKGTDQLIYLEAVVWATNTDKKRTSRILSTHLDDVIYNGQAISRYNEVPGSLTTDQGSLPIVVAPGDTVELLCRYHVRPHGDGRGGRVEPQRIDAVLSLTDHHNRDHTITVDWADR